MELVGKSVGNYVIEHPLKRGGMGSVYVAKHPALGRRVAIKFLETDRASGEMNSRFATEARITASLRHDHIVDIFDFGELEGKFYYVMELLSGRDLSEELAVAGKLPIEQALLYLVQVCDGLAAAHLAGIVHRDLKPGNIFVESGQPGTIKLMDFGVAKVLETEASKTNYGQILGTPAYMAPEQALGDQNRISARTDLYALGVIAYEMLSGKRPFRHEAPMMLVVAHIHEVCTPLREVAPEVPQTLCKLIESCMAKDQNDRPSSAAALKKALENCLEELTASLPHAVRPDRLAPPSTSEKASAKSAPPQPEGPVSEEPIPSTELAPVELAPGGAKPGWVGAAQDPLPKSEARAARTVMSGQAGPEPARQPATLLSGEALAAPIEPSAESSAEEKPPVSLDDEDRSVLKKLLARMKRRGDLPAFVENVGDVNKKADFEGKYSAHQLSEAILKDHSLTAKLLRVVNTTYVRRFGGKIFSVQQAIVILGFEQVRSLALSIAVFDKGKKGQNNGRIADSAVHSLMSGEIARSLAKSCGLKDEEQATVCSMFCNLGRHLALVYLPEQYDRAVEHAAQTQLSLERAAEKELGLSFQKLGIGVAEQWHLPRELLEAMTSCPAPGTQFVKDEQRLAALAHLSNDLCELVANGIRDEHDPKLQKLLRRHENLIEIDPEGIPQLLGEVEEVFRSRYAPLLGKKTLSSRFLQKLPELSPLSRKNRDARLAEEAKREEERGLPELEAEGKGAHPAQEPASGTLRAKRKRAPGQRRAIMALNLCKGATGDEACSASESPELEELRQLVERPGRTREAADRTLSTLARHLGVNRLLTLSPTPSGDELFVSHAVGEDAEALRTELRFPLSASKSNGDVFSRAFFGKKDVIIKDTFSEKSGSQIPRRYYEAIGSPGLLVLYCGEERKTPLLVLGDSGETGSLPDRSDLSRVVELRNLLARAVA